MPRRSSQSGGDGEIGASSKGSRRWRSRSRTRSRSRGRKQKLRQQQQQQIAGDTYYQAPPDHIEANGSEFAYVTSPPPVPKAGLTGNISSLFRKSFKRGSSGGERHTNEASAHPQSHQQQYHQHRIYTPPVEAGGSAHSPSAYDPNNSNHSSGIQMLGSSASQQQEQQKQRSSRFGIGGKKKGRKSDRSNNNSGSENHYPGAGSGYSMSGGRSVASGTNSRLFYSNADDDSDSEDSFDERSRSSRVRSASTKNTFTTGDGYNTSGVDESFLTDGSGSLSRSQSQSSRYSHSSKKKSKRHSTKRDDEDEEIPSTTILRYRGFSTSIKNLFLDEALVCASMGCFGLILSNRTEFLLQLRNDRRGVQWGRNANRQTLPSRIVAYALLLTLLLIGFTFVIWGFGSNSDNKKPFAFNNGSYNKGGSSSSSANNNNYDNANDDANYNNYNNDDGGYNGDDANANGDYNYNNNNDDDDDDDDANGRRQLGGSPGDRKQQKHCVNGIFKIRDMKESIWEPAIDFLSDEWYRPYQEQQVERQRQNRRQNHEISGHNHWMFRRDLENYADDNYNTNDDFSSLSATSSSRDVASDLRLSFIFAFLIVLGVLGRRRRMRTRYYIVRARAQEDHLFYASSGSGIKRVGFQDSREDQYEGACSHTLCGCYPTDPPREGDEIEDEVQVNDDGVSQRKKKPHNEDFVGRGFNCILGMCCGVVCRCWFQCLSICALAQEAREMRLLVPTRFQRVDYITHQPFHDYQKEVIDLRRGWMGKTRKKSGIMPHFNALSRLSRHILVLSISLTVIIGATLFLNPLASFSWPDVIILSATFLQSFLVIWIVHWIFHKSDLSLDAVIKFFAAGFVIAVPSAFFFEGLLVNITLSTAYFGYGLGQFMGGDTFVEWVSQQYQVFWILVEIFNAYIVAAVTEELCKYYTFRCVEHPDLIFLTGLVSNTQDERALEGGVVKYPFSSHQVQQTNAKNPYDDDASHYSRSSHRSKSSGRNTGLDPNEDDFEEDDQDVRTHRQKAAAVTTAMISVAVGLACAENFLYVFLLGGTGAGVSDDGSSAMDGYLQEWIVLLFRSIFPVHALAAAMQSVNMIRKFVEAQDVNGHRIGVGRIILPAVIMHGTFDAILLGINIFIETSWDEYLEANGGNIDDENATPYSPFVVNVVAWLSITLVMLSGFLWYYKENRSQRLRLIELEEQEKANLVGTSGYTSPRAPHVSEVELV